MSKIALVPGVRVTRDSQSDAIRTWFNPFPESMAKAPFAPDDIAYQLLKENAELFKWKTELQDLRNQTVVNGENAYSVRFTQEFKRIPVDSSEVVVNIYADGRVYSIYNNYHYDIPRELNPEKVKISAKEARVLINRLVRGYKKAEISDPQLIIYQYHKSENRPPKPSKNIESSLDSDTFLAAVASYRSETKADDHAPKEGEHYLVWDITVTTKYPSHDWRILIDALSGQVINVIDLFQYASGNSDVFDPNPIVTSGDTTLNGSSLVATLDVERISVTVDRLDPAVAGNLHLDGKYVKMAEIESPTFTEPVSPTGNFRFSSNNRNFLAAMCYFHIDRFQNYIQTELEMTNVCNFAIPVDPQGQSGADNSRYSSSNHDLAFGEGGVPDASDAHVILHEYGHAIQDNFPVREAASPPLPAFSNYSSGISEGFGDFLAAIYYDDKLSSSLASRGHMMSYDGNTTDSFPWNGRRYDITWLFDGAEFAGANGHNRGQLWCATMYELYRKLGGDSSRRPGVKKDARDLTIRLHLMANFHVARSGATATDMGQEIEAADGNLGGWRYANGLHKKVIYDTFSRRHLPNYPDRLVDVYINDGRDGGYGSPSGNDLFTENLWDENYWNTQDIWVTTTQYPNAAAQAAGGPADHVEPPVGSTAYLYVRVKNRGTDAAGSGQVVIKAFHCLPGMGLVWPDAWTSMDTPSISIANILPGVGNGVVVGPFPWVPTVVGHECVLAIVECPNDRAITQDLVSTDHVPHSDLVPFDNNIEQRNLVPTASKGKMNRGFYVNNPYPRVEMVKLNFENSLPKGWQWHTNLVGDQIRLGPLERRWVDLVIDQAEGQEITHFDKPQTLEISGTIDDRLIGGMTFYIAPPTVFPKPVKPTGSDIFPMDLCCPKIPWNECEVEGEVEFKIRFRKK